MAFQLPQGAWVGEQHLQQRQYSCAHCGSLVGSNIGTYYLAEGSRPHPLASHEFAIHICPFCRQPTYFCHGAQSPAPAFGEPVQNVPQSLNSLYEEARRCTGANAHTAAVLASRKILMHIAVEKGAEEGKPFLSYVEYLASKGYVPPDGKSWVDHIRSKANEANHEIALMEPADAEDLITFVEMLLKFIYEFPSKVSKRGAAVLPESINPPTT